LKTIEVLCFLGSFWMLIELKDHPLFKKMHFYFISVNDKLRDYKHLWVMDSSTTLFSEEEPSETTISAGEKFSKELCFKIFFDVFDKTLSLNK
jgi:hypothetical protein